MKKSNPAWLLLVTNLPGKNQTPRMRIWRALKAAGAAMLRDGVYVLPRTAGSQELFAEQATEIRSVAGSAHILAFDSAIPAQQNTLIKLFDRTADYERLRTRLDACKRGLAKLTELEARKALAAVARDVAATRATDFFPGKPQVQIRSALSDAQAALNARFSPNEPRPAHRRIPRRDRKDFLGRTWATRQHMWIDRVCSAWLIRRFIDPKAKFIWLKRIQGKPRRAIGFDFDGAQFSHVDAKVTFEVLLRSFGLEADAGLARLGELVHFLDVGGIPVAEAAGFAAIVSGARSLGRGDDALLRSVTPALDSLYRAYRAGAAGAPSGAPGISQ
jgi:hypothetical protein